MVTLEQIRASNAQLATAVRPGLVAVFAGATRGIGEASLRQFVKHAVKPRVYFLGRSEASGDRVRTELQKLNPEGEYIYITVDVSLLRSVDEVCREIKAKESAINLLFLSTGSLVVGKETEEGLHYPTAVAYYARLRFIVNLLPQLQAATGLRRVVSVLAGTKEGPVDTGDLQGRRASILRARGHGASIMTLALEAIAQKAPQVSFVHGFPGFVKTDLAKEVSGTAVVIAIAVLNAIFAVFGPLIMTPFDESGERHTFFATSARFPGRGDGAGAGAAAADDGVPLATGVAVARGTDGKVGGGVYSIGNDAESASPKVEKLLEGLRKDGSAEKVWADVEKEFVRITGTAAV